MSGWQVRAPSHFWHTLDNLRPKYSHEQLVEIVLTLKECIQELEATGHIEETGWSEHALRKSPFADGNHFEFHIFDDDVLVVYFRLERNRVIRMVGVYDHDSIPG